MDVEFIAPIKTLYDTLNDIIWVIENRLRLGLFVCIN